LVLAVSRKNNPNDFGLPGGKVDPNENFVDAVIREVFEETGLVVLRTKLIFQNYCGTPAKNVVYWTQAFSCLVSGEVNTQEKGRVFWIEPNRLIIDEFATEQSFSKYNKELFETVGPTQCYISKIPAKKELIYHNYKSFIK
jgi:8-oxo-dGTP pyrophosphatase MutT (NUDIX family)